MATINELQLAKELIKFPTVTKTETFWFANCYTYVNGDDGDTLTFYIAGCVFHYKHIVVLTYINGVYTYF